MAGTAAQTRSLDQMLKESREKRKNEELAQQIFGKRSKTPAGSKPRASLGGSLASRVGVAKRPSSLPRSNTAPAPRNVRPNRPASQAPARLENQRTKSVFAQPLSEPVPELKSNGFQAYDAAAENGSGLSIRGIASGPHIVVASNFAPGTTAADIESVMLDVGGHMTECKLIASQPTVIAEMTFVEKSGAETVINTFNNKKADGRTLHVYWKHSGTGPRGQEEAPAPPIEPVAPVEDVMEVDENAQSREAENRLREERRGRPDRAPRESFPPGPERDRGYQDDYYRGPRRAEPAYQDGRYGFGGGDRWGGRGRYNDNRMYSDRMGGRGQSWRP